MCEERDVRTNNRVLIRDVVVEFVLKRLSFTAHDVFETCCDRGFRGGYRKDARNEIHTAAFYLGSTAYYGRSAQKVRGNDVWVYCPKEFDPLGYVEHVNAQRAERQVDEWGEAVGDAVEVKPVEVKPVKVKPVKGVVFDSY